AVWGQDVEPATWGKRTRQADCPPGPPIQPTPPAAPGTQPPVPPSTQTPSEALVPEAFAQAGEGRTMPAEGYFAPFFGDMFGIVGTRFVFNTGGTTFPNGTVVRTQSASKGSGFKVVDSESPQPQTRIYYLFDYYNDVARSLNVNSGGQTFQGFRHI